ncbi:MFS transporter [Bartonella sp. DGB1]|uniref:MFS transporter n=1 Tax=Bartonella sp. DGB1 TaxID=3239807 RepID=UPI003523D312
MFTTYRNIFTSKGSFSFSMAGLIARLPSSMMTLSIITMLERELGNYTIPGIIAGIFAFTLALSSPVIARFSDIYGQGRVGIIFGTSSLLASLLFLFNLYLNGPLFILFILVFIMGFKPNYGAFVRTRWSEIFRGKKQLHTAFSFEAVIDEIVFIIGPALAVYLSVNMFSSAGLLAALFFLSTGGLWFCLQTNSEPKIKNTLKISPKPLIYMPSIQIIFLITVAVGTIISSCELVSVAFANKIGDPAKASYALVAYAVASLISGLLFGMVKWKKPLNEQLMLFTIAVLLLAIPPLFVNSLWQLILALFLAGFACAPLLICCFSVVEKISPPAQLTEGIAYEGSGIGIGVALGSITSGRLIDLMGAQYGFLIAIIASAAALLLLFLTSNKLKKALDN